MTPTDAAPSEAPADGTLDAPRDEAASPEPETLPETAPVASPEPLVEASPEPAANATSGPAAPLPDETPPAEPETVADIPPPPEPSGIALGDLSTSAARVEAGGDGVRITGVATAANISRIAAILVDASSAGLVARHDITIDELAATTPTVADDGFEVWRIDERSVGFSWRFAPARGTAPEDHDILVAAVDDAGVSSDARAVTVRVLPFSDIDSPALPVGADGSVISGASWGAWAVRAGARNVTATNYLKVQNVGDVPDARVVLDFGTDGFRGVEDGRFVIPTAGNLEFAWWEAENATSRPGEGSFAWHAATGAASDTLRFTHVGGVIFVLYRIQQTPAVLPVQQYGTAYTLTEV